MRVLLVDDEPELIFTLGGQFLSKVAPLWPRLGDAMMEMYRRSLERAIDAGGED